MSSKGSTRTVARAHPLEERERRDRNVETQHGALTEDRKSAPLTTSLTPQQAATAPRRPLTSTAGSSAAAAAAAATRNPFYEHQRNNFPDFEVALKPASLCEIFNEEEDHDDDGIDYPDFQPMTMTDFSVCSGDGGSSSILNMSIGARAALNEHLRHIAKFGID
ncbi:MAG: hypothetical protein SGILL_001297, partial [Bacillariaceae sp.]